MQILAPITGRVVPLKEVPDEVFSEGMAGEGVAIIPSHGGEAVAPVSGTLAKLFEGGHAFVIVTEGAVELVVHLGLDTIELQGRGFEKLAVEGDQVEAGQPIVHFELQSVRSAGYNPITPVVVADAGKSRARISEPGEVSAGDAIFEVES